jgi:hypothetical protein
MSAVSPVRVSVAPQPPLKDPYDFSLVLGGPLYQLVRQTRLSDDALELLHRRIIASVLLAWLPLAILSALGGRAWGEAVTVPFLVDIEVHIRFLLALPLLILAELVVHRRLRPVVQQFLERSLIAEASRAKFDAAVAAAMRLRNSVVVEVLLIVFIYAFDIFIWSQYATLKAATWYGVPADGGRELSLAGWWFLYISLPFFQFIVLRWYFRLFIWMRFLWQASRCELSLVPTHPDRLGGLGFLSGTVIAFGPLLAAHGVLLAGMIASRIFFDGAALTDFKVEIAVVVAYLLVLVLGPFVVFIPNLSLAKRVGMREYGTLAGRYVQEFDRKWLRGGALAGEPLVGSADIQSLADLGNSYEVVRGMRFAPITRDAVLQLAVITLLPVAPLLLTMISWEELLKRLLEVLL